MIGRIITRGRNGGLNSFSGGFIPPLSLPFPRSFFPKQRACSQAMYLLVSSPNELLVPIMKILRKIACFGSGSGPGGYSPHKSYRGARRKIRLHTKRFQNLVLCPTSTITNFITGAANFNHGRKDNFRILSSQGLLEIIVINLYTNKAYHLWQQSF